MNGENVILDSFYGIIDSLDGFNKSLGDLIMFNLGGLDSLLQNEEIKTDLINSKDRFKEIELYIKQFDDYKHSIERQIEKGNLDIIDIETTNKLEKFIFKHLMDLVGGDEQPRTKKLTTGILGTLKEVINRNDIVDFYVKQANNYCFIMKTKIVELKEMLRKFNEKCQISRFDIEKYNELIQNLTLTIMSIKEVL